MNTMFGSFDFFCLHCVFGSYLGNASNPCVLSPSYETWAPWIGPQTRNSNIVFNTEYMKGKGRNQSTVLEQEEVEITEERLTDEIMNLKVRLPFPQTYIIECPFII